MYERELVGVYVGLQCGLMHQGTGHKVRQHERIKLLSDKVRAFATQDFDTAQMGLDLIQGSLDFPTLMIERPQFVGRRQLWIQNGGDQPIERLCAGNAVQSIFDDAQHEAVGLVPPVTLSPPVPVMSETALRL